MEYPPCLNPSCHSRGKSHPNCACYQQQSDGGQVDYFCSTDRPHKEDCEYFAEGGSVPEGTIPVGEFETMGASASGGPEGAIPIDQFESHEGKYGTLGQQGLAAVEGLGKGLAGPLATLAEKKLGVKGEDIEARAEENPVTHYGAEAVGLVAPALLTEGTSLLPKLTQAGVLEKAGSLASKALGVEGASKVAVKMGVENALFTLGDEVSKAINGNPNSIETAAMHVGLSGLLGAGIGAPLGKVSELWTSKLGPKAEEFVKDFTDSLKMADKDVSGEAAEFVPTYDEPIKNLSRPGSPLFKKAAQGTEEEVAPTQGQKTADWLLNKIQNAASEALADGVGGALGKLSGIPYGKYLGAFFGHNYLKPFISTVLPSVIKPILQSEASATGLKAAFEAVNAIAKGESAATKAAANLFETGTNAALDAHSTDQAKINKLKARVDELHGNPEAMMDLNGSLGHYMPNHNTALMSISQNTVNYLASKKPQSIKMGVLDPKIPPHPSEEAAYNRTLQIAESPLSILSHVKKGTLQPKDMVDLKTLYPGLHENISQKVQHAMIDHLAKEGAIPYKTRAGLGILLGQPVDSSFTPTAMMAAQATFFHQMSPQTAQGNVKKKKGTSAIGKSADLAQTPSEARRETLKD